jgi:two-component system NarL family response regulator
MTEEYNIVQYEKRIRVLLADCHHRIGKDLAALISDEPEMHSMRHTADPDAAIAALFRDHQPDIHLMDLRMTEESAVEAIKMLLTEIPNGHALVLATVSAKGEIAPALREGAIDCCLKDMPCEEMVHVIRTVCIGKRPSSHLQRRRPEQP